MPAGFPNIRNDPSVMDAQAVLRARAQQQQAASTSRSQSESTGNKNGKDLDEKSITSSSSLASSKKSLLGFGRRN